MINGLMTLRGAWHKVTSDPILKFFVVGVTFYGMSTFEGPMLSVKSVNSLSHYTDWTIAHVHGGTLGWNGFMVFGMIYFLMPRLFQTKVFSQRLIGAHFWVATIGILLYVIPIYVAGLTQGLMWRAFDASGVLKYPEFVETVSAIIPMYWVRVAGGLLYFSGALMCAYNMLMTWRARPARFEEQVHEAPSLRYVPIVDPRRPVSELTSNVEWGKAFDVWSTGWWHRIWERKPLRFTVFVVAAVGAASLFEMIPTFLIRSNVPSIASVKPYTPLELAGRDIYVAEGCYNCHSQMIRPIYAETKRYGEYSKPGEFVYDHPFQWGSRRIGPDLAREGASRSDLWHLLHLRAPANTTQGSIMPRYPWLIESDLDFKSVQARVNAMAMLGVPYGKAVLDGAAESLAREQAAAIAERIRVQGAGSLPGDVPADLQNKQVVALIAYLQRLGTDISAPAAPAPTAPGPAAAPAPAATPGTAK